MPKAPYFSRELFQFLVELKFNNERAWFNANKPRYEDHVKKPMLRFLADAAPRVQKVNAAITRPAFFRIYRDTRFAKDKTPYKTHAAVQFRHSATANDAHAPGFYIHFEPGDCFVAGGIWQPESGALLAIRKRIAAKDAGWMAVKKAKLKLYTEDALKRPPKGFSPEHPMLEDLRLKSYMSWVSFSDKEACDEKMLERTVAACKKLDPLVRFLCGAMKIKA
jgi:uncharacterized protein (TIGR02453 family)